MQNCYKIVLSISVNQSILYFKFLERDGNRGPWPASVILIGLDWSALSADFD